MEKKLGITKRIDPKTDRLINNIPTAIIVAFKDIHGDLYDYSKSDYKTRREKIEIICPNHGSFWQTPTCHAHGQKCPRCATTSRTITNDEFIARAQTIHGTKYDYSMCNYTSHEIKVEIICPEHGSFRCSSSNHLHKDKPTGCPLCGRLATGKKRRETGYVSFLERAEGLYGTRYDYSLVDYRGAFVPVEIICERHGSFFQSPANHTSGHNCSQCAHENRPLSLGENQIASWLDANQIIYQREKTFGDLRNPLTGYQLRYDFFIPNRNMIVEFDGEHHFVPVRGDVDRLCRIQARDAIKNQYASNNGYSLIRISDRSAIEDTLARVVLDG